MLFTAPRILALAAAGTIDLDAPLVSVLPDFRQYNLDNWERKVTFRQCLGHQTPFPAVFDLYLWTRSGTVVMCLRAAARNGRQGRRSIRTSISSLFGLALERLERRSIRAMAPGAGFAWSAPADQAAATEDDTWRLRVLERRGATTMPQRCRARGMRGCSGRRRRCSTSAAARLGDTGRMRADPDAIRRAARMAGSDEGWSGASGVPPQTIGHTGFTGTGLWIDFARGQAWTLPDQPHPSDAAFRQRYRGAAARDRRSHQRGLTSWLTQSGPSA